MKVNSWQQLELRRLVATAAAAQLVEDVVRALILRRDEGGNQSEGTRARERNTCTAKLPSIVMSTCMQGTRARERNTRTAKLPSVVVSTCMHGETRARSDEGGAAAAASS